MVFCTVLTSITVLFAGGTGFYLHRLHNAVWDAATDRGHDTAPNASTDMPG